MPTLNELVGKVSLRRLHLTGELVEEKEPVRKELGTKGTVGKILVHCRICKAAWLSLVSK